jgi:hypothetical protein
MTLMKQIYTDNKICGHPNNLRYLRAKIITLWKN